MKRRRRRDGPTYGELEIITKEGKGDFSLPPSSSPRKLEKFLFEKSGKGVALAVACMERWKEIDLFSSEKKGREFFREGVVNGKGWGRVLDT